MVQPTEYKTKFKVSTEVQGDGKLKGFTQSLREITQTGQQSAKSLKEIASAAGGLSGSLDAIRRSSLSSTRALQNDIRKIRDELREMGREAKNANQAFVGIGGAGGAGGFGGIAVSLGSVKGQALAAALAVREFVQSLRAVAEVRARVDQLAAGLDIVNKGNFAKSASDMQFLRETVDRLGLSFSQTSDLFVKVNAAAAQTSLTTKQTREIFESFAGTVGRLNLSADSSNRIFFALQQIISKGTVSSEELKNQLGEKIPGVMAIAARAFDGGKGDVEKFNKALADGKVISEDFLPKLATELRETFNLESTTRIDTASASLNRFDTAIDGLKRQIAEGFIGDLAVATFDSFTNAINATTRGLGYLGDAIDDIIDNGNFNKLLGFIRNGLESSFGIDIIAKPLFQIGDALSNAVSTSDLDRIKQLNEEIAKLESGNTKTRPGFGDTSGKNSSRRISQLKAELKSLIDIQNGYAEKQRLFEDQLAENTGFAIVEQANSEAAKAAKAAAKAKEEADKKAQEAGERIAKQRATAIDQLDEYLIQLDRELDKGESLSKVDKMRIDLAKLYNGILPEGLKAQLALAESREAELASIESATKLLEEYNKQAEQEQEAIEKNIESIRDRTADIREQNLEYSMSKSAIEELTIAELERKAAAETTSEAMRSDIQREIAARRDLVDAIRENESLEAAKKLSEEFDKAADDVKKSLTDALVEGTVNAGQFIRDYFKNFTIRLLINPVLDAGSAAIKQLLLGGTGVGGASAGILGQGGNFAGGVAAEAAKKFFADPVGVIKNAYSLFQTGLGETFGKAAQSVADILGASAELQASIGNSAIKLGNVAGQIGVALAGYSLGKTISGGFSLNGGTGNSTVNTGAIAGAIVGSIVPGIGTALGAALGSILGGSINRLFGRKTVLGGSGLQGNFSAGGFAGSTFQDVTQKGGFFRSSRSFTQFGSLSPEAFAAIRDYLTSLNTSLISASRILQSDAEKALKDFAVSGKFYGSLQSILEGVGNQLIKVVLPTISEFQLQGEKLADTLSRLVQSVATANQATTLLGQGAVFTANNIQSALSLLETGGEGLLSQIQAYVTAFVPAGEQATRQLQLFNESIRQAGLTSVISADTTKEEFVRLVEGLDLTTEAGQRQLQVLLALAPQLDAIIQQRQREREAVTQARLQVQGYIDLLTGNVPTTLQQLGTQIVGITNALSKTTDIQTRIGLEQQLGELIFQRYNAELEMLGQVLQSVQEVFASIENERAAIQSARDTIGGGGPRVLNASQIRSAVLEAGQLGALPSSNSIANANDRVAQLQSQLQAQEQITASALAQQSQSQDALTSQINLAKRAVQVFNANTRVGSAFATNSGGGQTVASFDEQTLRTLVDYAYITFNVGDEASVRALRTQINETIRTELNNSTIADALFGANSRILQAQQNLAAASSSAGVSQAQELQLVEALAAAERDRIAAQEAFVASLADYVADAGKAVNKLGQLREETVKFYEQQAALAQLMIGQANALRDTVRNIRFADLNPLQQLENLQSQFAFAFANASVSSGDTLAGFGGDINALIGPILEKAAEVYASGPEFQRIKELVLSQAETVASRLEQLSPQNYQQESLSLLDTIDSTLDIIQENTKSAERLIVDAIDRSKDATLQGLRGVIAAINGESIPAFRRGGDHIGGPRLVGGGGAELEVTGPARIYSNRQLGQMLMGAPGSEEVVAELRAMRKEMQETGQINLKVVTTDGKVIMDKTLSEIKERSRKGELIVYSDGVR